MKMLLSMLIMILRLFLLYVIIFLIMLLVLARPNGYILAYFNCFTGETCIKSMSEWVSNFDFSEGVFL